jgi:hypothetical protein
MSDVISDASDVDVLLEPQEFETPMIDQLETKEQEEEKSEAAPHRLTELNSMPLVRFAPRKQKHKLIVLPTFSLRGRSLYAMADWESRHLALQEVTLQYAGPVSLVAIADSIVPSQQQGRDVLIAALSKARVVEHRFILLPVGQSFSFNRKFRLVEDAQSSLSPRLHQAVIGEMKYQRGKVFSFVIRTVIGILVTAVGLKAPSLFKSISQLPESQKEETAGTGDATTDAVVALGMSQVVNNKAESIDVAIK